MQQIEILKTWEEINELKPMGFAEIFDRDGKGKRHFCLEKPALVLGSNMLEFPCSWIAEQDSEGIWRMRRTLKPSVMSFIGFPPALCIDEDKRRLLQFWPEFGGHIIYVDPVSSDKILEAINRSKLGQS